MAIDYGIVDPILIENPGISFKDFRKKCKTPISSWSFNNRRRVLQGKSAYRANSGGPLAQGVKAEKTSETASINPVKWVNKYAPQSRRKKEYVKAVKILLDDPGASYSKLKAAGKVKFSDANWYALRRALSNTLKNGGPVSVKSSAKPVVENKSKPGPKPGKKRKGLFLNIFEKELNGKKLNPEVVSVMQEFINALNDNGLGNFQLREVISPDHVLEVRSFARV